MLPILFEIGHFPIHTYGVIVAIGFLVAVWFMRHEAYRLGWNVEKIVDFSFIALFIGFLGSRTFFVLTQLPYFMKHPLEIIAIWEGGMVFYGGPIFVVPWALWWVKKNNLQSGTLSDLSVQALALGHAIGRWGCVAAGCCYGKECAYPWGIRFYTEIVDNTLRGVPLHPVQIYESLAIFLLFIFLRKLWHHRSFQGQVALVYFMGYAAIRFVMEIYRGDMVRGFIVPDYISVSQFISILVFTAAAALYLKFFYRMKLKK